MKGILIFDFLRALRGRRRRRLQELRESITKTVAQVQAQEPREPSISPYQRIELGPLPGSPLVLRPLEAHMEDPFYVV